MTPEEVDAVIRLAKACAEEACGMREVDSEGYRVCARTERKEREAAEHALKGAAARACARVSEPGAHVAATYTMPGP